MMLGMIFFNKKKTYILTSGIKEVSFSDKVTFVVMYTNVWNAVEWYGFTYEQRYVNFRASD